MVSLYSLTVSMSSTNKTKLGLSNTEAKNREQKDRRHCNARIAKHEKHKHAREDLIKHEYY